MFLVISQMTFVEPLERLRRTQVKNHCYGASTISVCAQSNWEQPNVVSDTDNGAFHSAVSSGLVFLRAFCQSKIEHQATTVLSFFLQLQA